MAQQESANKNDEHLESEEIEKCIDEQMIETVAAAIGLQFTGPEIDLMLKGVNERLSSYEKLREISLANDVAPALTFAAAPPEQKAATGAREYASLTAPADAPEVPTDLEELAFAPIAHLAHLIRTRQVTALELTEMYLGRLERYGPALECVVTLTEELARTQAKLADEEIAAGNYRGPLHGIPWGAKDLLATRDIPTSWGAMPYKNQMIDEDATVVGRLRDAGAVLVAKLTLGALAWGDVWFGGKTRNPWNRKQGSSGSSAGSAAAIAAGLVGFAIGTETYGSIISPCHRCGVTGLRPTFGRVSRHGAMALSWSMDKIGPIGRTVEDCALVFDAIHGADGKDLAAVTRPFLWHPEIDLDDLRIGYLKSAFDEERDNKHDDDESLRVLRRMGAQLVPFELPQYPVESLSFILMAEAAAAFDELTRTGQDDLMVRQTSDAWPNAFREARLIPAVEYIQANRIRTLVMKEMSALMEQIDLFVAPSFGGDNLLLTNLTGNPAVVVPNGLSDEGIPSSSITFIGRLFDETSVLAVAKAYQDQTHFHLQHPPMDW